jgi:hypothetical protein
VRQRLASELADLLLDPGGDGHAAAAQTPFQEVHVCARESRVRRAQEGEQVAPLALEPGVAEQGDQRLAERRLAQAQAALERVGHAEGRERGVERSAPAVEGGADDRDLGGIRSCAHEREHLLGHELERSSQAGALEKSDRAVELRRAALLAEEPTLEIGKRGRSRTGFGGSSSRVVASAFRSSEVRDSDAKASRPGSYGSETVTSARAASTSSSAHSAPVRSSKP